MASFANQKDIKIHKPTYSGNFVQVHIGEWQEAFATLTRSGFGLYLYCCGNQDGYKLELSSAAVQNALHISDSSYRRAVEELLEKGYFIKKTDTKYDFYTSRNRQPMYQSPRRKKPATARRRRLYLKKPMRHSPPKPLQGRLFLSLLI